MVAVVATLGATLLGGCLSFVGGWAQSALAMRRARRAYATALVCEIRSLIDLVRRNGFVQQMRDGAARSRDVSHPGLSQEITTLADDKYFAVFDGSVSSIGTLPPLLAARVVAFYQTGRSIRETLSPNNPEKLDLHDRFHVADFYDGMANDLEDMFRVGLTLCHDMDDQLGLHIGDRLDDILGNTGATVRPSAQLD